MAFVTGIADSAADLRTALVVACTENGWTESGGIISRGGAFVKITAGANSLIVYAGTGQSSANITGGPQVTGASASPGNPQMWVSLCGAAGAIAWPVTYAIHIFDNEVYCWVNYNVSKWAWCAFGKSPAPGIPGTGVWFAATGSGHDSYAQACIGLYNSYVGTSGAGARAGCGLFWAESPTNTIATAHGPNAMIQHGLDGTPWSLKGTDGIGSAASANWSLNVSGADALSPLRPHLERSPNAWNGESVLFPIQPHVRRASGFVSMAGDIKHARFVRLDNYEPGQIITLGHDRWRVYPWLERNTTARDAGGTSSQPLQTTHSGTFGIAVRYDGD